MQLVDWSERGDAELVLAAVIGNLEAFGELVLRFRPAVSSVVSGILNSREAVEDVVQDTFLLAFKALPRLRDTSSFASWLCAIARNRAIRYGQREGRMTPRSMVDVFVLKESSAFDGGLAENPATIMEQEESCNEVREALGKLPEEYQIVLRLRYWSEMPLRKIEEFLGIPLSVVKWRIYKGKQLLKERLEKGRKEEYQWQNQKKKKACK